MSSKQHSQRRRSGTAQARSCWSDEPASAPLTDADVAEIVDPHARLRPAIVDRLGCLLQTYVDGDDVPHEGHAYAWVPPSVVWRQASAVVPAGVGGTDVVVRNPKLHVTGGAAAVLRSARFVATVGPAMPPTAAGDARTEHWLLFLLDRRAQTWYVGDSLLGGVSDVAHRALANLQTNLAPVLVDSAARTAAAAAPKPLLLLGAAGNGPDGIHTDIASTAPLALAILRLLTNPAEPLADTAPLDPGAFASAVRAGLLDQLGGAGTTELRLLRLPRYARLAAAVPRVVASSASLRRYLALVEHDQAERDAVAEEEEHRADVRLPTPVGTPPRRTAVIADLRSRSRTPAGSSKRARRSA